MVDNIRHYWSALITDCSDSLPTPRLFSFVDYIVDQPITS